MTTIRQNSIKMGDHVIRFEEDPDPGEFFLEKARLELRETPERREAAVKELREKIKNTEDLEWVTEDDVIMLTFLRSCKFYMDSTYDKVVRTFKFREKHAKYFEDLQPGKEKKVFESNIFTILPYRDQHGRRTLIVEVGKKWNPKELSLTDLIRGVIIVIEAAQLEPKTQISGVNIILDMDGLTMNHVWQFSPSFAKFLLEFVQHNLPLRIKAVHVVNQPYIFNMLFAVFKPFILEKLRERILFHGNNMSTLLEHIEPKFVPTQYGGKLEFECKYGEEVSKLLFQYQDKFDEVNKRGFKSKKK